MESNCIKLISQISKYIDNMNKLLYIGNSSNFIPLTIITFSAIFFSFLSYHISLLVYVSADSGGLSDLGDIGDRIKGLDLNSGYFYGNIETCASTSTCLGTENDDIIYSGSKSPVFSLDGDDVIFGGSSSRMFGGNDNDIILASGGNSLLEGGPGDDSLFSGSGNDLLNGGKGNDKLFAGTGDTIMKGGSGANHFDCPISLLGLARAVVLDYNPDDGDTIAGQCKIVNNVQDDDSSDVPKIKIPH